MQEVQKVFANSARMENPEVTHFLGMPATSTAYYLVSWLGKHSMVGGCSEAKQGAAFVLGSCHLFPLHPCWTVTLHQFWLCFSSSAKSFIFIIYLYTLIYSSPTSFWCVNHLLPITEYFSTFRKLLPSLLGYWPVCPTCPAPNELLKCYPGH